jgi:type II secretory pathway predicted ATPase ExeA
MYERHFRLTDRPFRLTPDARFFFPSDQHRRALAFLEYGLHEGEGFIVITGEPGTGKSTLVARLMAEHERDPLRVATIETSVLSGDNLLEMLLARFGIRPPRSPTKTSLIEALRSDLARSAKGGRRALAIIDEAQNLPDATVEELRMLSNLAGPTGPLLQIFLVGQSELRERLQEAHLEQLRQRVTASFHLRPFQADELRAYVEHRLKAAGWKARPAFAREAWPALYVHTGGIPRLINTLCDRILLYCFLEERDQVDARSVELVAEETQVRAPETSRETAEAAAAPSGRGANERDAPLPLSTSLDARLGALEERVRYAERRIRLDLASLRRLLQPPEDP